MQHTLWGSLRRDSIVQAQVRTRRSAVGRRGILRFLLEDAGPWRSVAGNRSGRRGHFGVVAHGMQARDATTSRFGSAGREVE